MGNSAGGGASQAAYASTLQNLTAELAENPSPVTTLPSTGTAAFNGVVTVAAPQVNLTESAMGAMEMDVDFATARFTGSAGNFIASDANLATGRTTSTRTDGSFTFEGDVAPGASGLTGDVRGNIALPSSGNVDLTGDFSGAIHQGDNRYLSMGGLYMEDAQGNNYIGNFVMGE
ncbi:MAG: hypothetical protein VX874_13155 [Pseudomonadota bacterium]|nr:hypothetical protein [Pseudomonadota bacterium]